MLCLPSPFFQCFGEIIRGFTRLFPTVDIELLAALCVLHSVASDLTERRSQHIVRVN